MITIWTKLLLEERSISIRNMKYYDLIYDDEHNKNAILLEINEESLGFNRYDTEMGIPFKKWNENIEINYSREKNSYITDYIDNDLAWLLITERFKTVLEKYDLGNVQFLPVTAVSKDGSEEIRGYLLNICNIPDALNRKESKYSVHKVGKEKWLSIQRYVLTESQIGPYDIFRIKDDYFTVFVSERIKKAIKDNKITGCDFVEIKVV